MLQLIRSILRYHYCIWLQIVDVLVIPEFALKGIQQGSLDKSISFFDILLSSTNYILQTSIRVGSALDDLKSIARTVKVVFYLVFLHEHLHQIETEYILIHVRCQEVNLHILSLLHCLFQVPYYIRSTTST